MNVPPLLTVCQELCVLIRLRGLGSSVSVHRASLEMADTLEMVVMVRINPINNNNNNNIDHYKNLAANSSSCTIIILLLAH